MVYKVTIRINSEFCFKSRTNPPTLARGLKSLAAHYLEILNS